MSPVSRLVFSNFFENLNIDSPNISNSSVYNLSFHMFLQQSNSSRS
uniref:Uncharacterized protein n=1 Tax=Manihot esculenta TaxID=3983 RepID=A0A2C9U1X6_MANES